MRILIRMKAKYDIYIRKDLQPLLDEEENMSGLINDLLYEHFENVYKKQEDFALAGIRSTVTHQTKGNKVLSTVTPNKVDIEKVKEDVAKIKPLVKLLGECPRHHIDRSVCKCT